MGGINILLVHQWPLSYKRINKKRPTMSIFDRIRQTHKPVSHPKAVHGLFGYLIWSSVSPLGSARSIEFKVKAGMRRKA